MANNMEVVDINLWVACSDGKLDMVKEFIESGKHGINDKDDLGYTPIHAAVSWGHLDLLDYLLANGADPNIGDIDGDTPLHVCERPDIAKIIVKAGAIPDKPNNEGFTPADAARDDKNLEMYEYFHSIGIVSDDELGLFKLLLEAPIEWVSGGEEDEDEAITEEEEEEVVVVNDQ